MFDDQYDEFDAELANIWAEILELAGRRGWRAEALTVALAQGLGQLIHVHAPRGQEIKTMALLHAIIKMEAGRPQDRTALQ